MSAPNPAKIKALVDALLPWFAREARDLPWRRTRDPYAIWVSEIMLQQTQVKTVIPYWERWMQALPTLEAAAAASSDQIHKLWEGLGYYTRVRNLQKAAQLIVERHSGRFPEAFDDILALPGIGRYTAGAISSIAFNQPAPILDGNVIRVLTRLYAIAENPKDKQTNDRLWRLAKSLVPRPAPRAPRLVLKPISDGTRRAHLHPAPAAVPALPRAAALRSRAPAMPRGLPQSERYPSRHRPAIHGLRSGIAGRSLGA
jgi:A/G-specific adenine glycosylase